MNIYDYEIFPEIHLCVFVARGKIDLEEFKSTGKRMLDDERWVPGGNFLMDYRKCQMPDLGYDRMQSGVAKERGLEALIGDGKLALVTDRKLMYGFGRMWQAMSEERSIDIHITWDLADGLKFLGVEEPLQWRGQPLGEI